MINRQIDHRGLGRELEFFRLRPTDQRRAALLAACGAAMRASIEDYLRQLERTAEPRT